VVTYEIEGTLTEMSEADINTTKANVEAAFLSASNGAIAKDDIESIELVQKEQARRGRRATTIDVIITLKATVDKSTAENAAATPVDFEVVVDGVPTKVTVTGTVSEVVVNQLKLSDTATTAAPSGKKGKKEKKGKDGKSKKSKQEQEEQEEQEGQEGQGRQKREGR